METAVPTAPVKIYGMAGSITITTIRALVVTEDATAAEWLSSQQWLVSPLHPRSVTSDKAQSVSKSIKAGSYGLVWLEIPRSGAAVPVQRRRAVNRQLALWMRQAHAAGTPACLLDCEEECGKMKAMPISNEIRFCTTIYINCALISSS